MIQVNMHTGTHDEALIVSAQFLCALTPPAQTAVLLELMTAEMEKINVWANESDVLIGHLKAYVKWPEDSVMLTTTGTDVQVKGASVLPDAPAGLDVGITGIMYGTSLMELEEKIRNLAGNILDNLHLKYEYSYECRNPHCTDPNHHHEHHEHHEHGHSH
ncbi:MAG: hypothetical protein GXY20_10970 [Clostridiales bacterium]|nr:hypothetical protein [Clostridiales bacterium]